MYNGLITYTASIDGDTIVGGKTYLITRTSAGATALVRQESGNYYQSSLTPPILTDVPMLKENASEGTSWEYDAVINGTHNHYVYLLEKRGLKHTVNGKEYSNVIKVNLKDTLKIFGNPIAGTEVDYYYAKGVGLIEFVQPKGKISLVSYSIK